MSCSCKGSLEYTCPSHGGWGMVRIAMLIPESHQLFVCPSACGRHGALGAIQQGFKNRLSYFYLEESDIISGYDNTICEAVGELLERLPKRPKVMVIFVSCLDDLIGTDCDAVIYELSRTYKDIQFRMGHMNPISNNSDEPPLVSTWKTVYSLMEKTLENPIGGINMIGNYVPVRETSEILKIMKVLGMEVYHVGNFEKYEQLKDMGNHYFNLVVSSPVEKVAKQLKQTKGIEYVIGHITYDLKEIRENYKLIVDKLLEIKKNTKAGIEKQEKTGQEIVENQNCFCMKEKMLEIETILEEYEKKAKQAIEKAKAKIGNRSIYIDYSAFGKPFEVAKFLYEQGFHIERVYVKEIEEENEAYQWLLKETDIEVIKANKHDTVNKWKSKKKPIENNNSCNCGGNCHCSKGADLEDLGVEICNCSNERDFENSSVENSISIGMEAGYISGSPHVVAMFQNEGMYGFDGVCLLMEKLMASIEEETDLETVIHQVGLVV